MNELHVTQKRISSMFKTLPKIPSAELMLLVCRAPFLNFASVSTYLSWYSVTSWDFANAAFSTICLHHLANLNAHSSKLAYTETQVIRFLNAQLWILKLASAFLTFSLGWFTESGCPASCNNQHHFSKAVMMSASIRLWLYTTYLMMFAISNL